MADDGAVLDDRELLRQVLLTRLVRLNAVVYGIVTGLVIGLVIFIATNWLILRGGPIGPTGNPVIGPNMALLGQFLLGYEVTFVGSLIGFAYGLGGGFLLGFVVAQLYNWLVSLKLKKLENQIKATKTDTVQTASLGRR